MKSNNALIVILGTVTLDAVGIGLVMPVLPGLLRDIVHSDSIASHYGVLLALYALMQFLCAPVLGALSDRFGRRPVLLASLLGATIDYAIMATTPVLWILYAGRIVAGITGATGAVAGAYIADITDGEDRARHFGLMSACFGVGMVAGPVAGGLLGAISLHAPFLAAAVLNGLNLLLGCFLMQESHKGERRPMPLRAFNPVSSFRWARGMTIVACGIRNLARPRSSLRHWSRHQTFRREAGHYRRHGGRRAGLRLAGVRDARLDGLPHYDSSRFRRHRDARVAGHAVQAGR